MRVAFPFIFLGAGKPHYYEHCWVTIKFRRTPTHREAEQLLQLVPRGLYTDPFDFRGSFTAAWNDSYIQHAIQKYYGDAEDKLPVGRHELLWCSPKASVSFEKTIIRWLMKVHALVPIELVFRVGDDASDGIEFSAWHHWSVKATVTLLERWTRELSQISEVEEPAYKDLLLGISGYVPLPEGTIDGLAKRYPGHE